MYYKMYPKYTLYRAPYNRYVWNRLNIILLVNNKMLLTRIFRSSNSDNIGNNLLK